MRGGLAVAAVLAAAAVLAGCGNGGGDDPVRPLLDGIGPAMAAVDAERGGPQDYFEVNATDQAVTLFVATDGATRVVRYVYVGSELGPAGDPMEAEGETFTAAEATFDPSTILSGVTDDLQDADVVLFSIAGGPAGAVQYQATVRSAQGGTLQVVLAPDGSVQSVDAG